MIEHRAAAQVLFSFGGCGTALGLYQGPWHVSAGACHHSKADGISLIAGTHRMAAFVIGECYKTRYKMAESGGEICNDINI
jgi:hypothetical protein